MIQFLERKISYKRFKDKANVDFHIAFTLSTVTLLGYGSIQFVIFFRLLILKINKRPDYMVRPLIDLSFLILNIKKRGRILFSKIYSEEYTLYL